MGKGEGPSVQGPGTLLAKGEGGGGGTSSGGGLSSTTAGSERFHGSSSQRGFTTCSETCFDLLLIEMLSLYCSTSSTSSTNNTRPCANGAGDGAGATPAMAMPHYTADTTELVKPKLEHLERMGYQVGCQLGERYSRKKVRFEDTLDAVKFLCKDFWTEVFKKQVDNLKTNHRGVFVLYDGRFRWLRHCSGRGQPGGSSSAKPTGAEGGDQRDAPAASTGSPQGPGAADLLRFPCGLIRGALASLGVKSQVSADVASALPACSFTVKIQGHQQKKK